MRLRCGVYSMNEVAVCIHAFVHEVDMLQQTVLELRDGDICMLLVVV